MKRLILFYTLVILFCISWMNSQAASKELSSFSEAPFTQIKVTGFVADESGNPLIGATIREKGTSNGTITHSDGKFELSVVHDAVLNVSYIGYVSQEIVLHGNLVLNIVLKENTVLLDNIIITALGLEKKANSLSYATDQIKNEELTRVKMPNLVSSLAGKSAGVQIRGHSLFLGF